MKFILEIIVPGLLMILFTALEALVIIIAINLVWTSTVLSWSNGLLFGFISGAVAIILTQRSKEMAYRGIKSYFLKGQKHSLKQRVNN